MSSAQRQKQFYGFTAALATYLLYALYVAWALLPDNLIKAAGITWYPNRDWALLVPAWSFITVLLTYFTYFALALFNTPAPDHISTITDPRALVLTKDSPYSSYMDFADAKTIPEAYDMPLGLVNKLLYSRVPAD